MPAIQQTSSACVVRRWWLWQKETVIVIVGTRLVENAAASQTPRKIADTPHPYLLISRPYSYGQSAASVRVASPST
jgi:hypothetical protein